MVNGTSLHIYEITEFEHHTNHNANTCELTLHWISA